jgi:hypothetical protein
MDANNSIAGIQERNRELCGAKLYHGQKQLDRPKANVRYEFLPHDTHRLYKKYARINGINLDMKPEYNIEAWLNPESPSYKRELAEAIYHYQARTEKSERLQICIQTTEMREAAWKYSHEKQVILDGTFGIFNSRILLFIALGIDEQNKGVPLTFLLFSAPSGSKATHASYDTVILTELLKEWKSLLGLHNGAAFSPKVAITDTDTKERRALVVVWPSICLLLCKFHLQQCWTNKHRTLLKGGKHFNFSKEQVTTRLRALEAEYGIIYILYYF